MLLRLVGWWKGFSVCVAWWSWGIKGLCTGVGIGGGLAATGGDGLVVLFLLWYGVVECALNGLYWSGVGLRVTRVVISGWMPGWSRVVWASVVSEGP